MAKQKGSGRPVGETLGGILAGFDQQIFRNQPPPHELVSKGAPVRGLSGEDDGEIRLVLPGTPSTSSEGQMATSTADLMDTGADQFDVCELQLHQYGAVRRFAGPVRTVRCLEDNVLLRRLLETPGDGQVLVVDGGGSYRTALLGDVVAGRGVANGWAGIVVNGCVRDVDALGKLPIGIRALGSNPRPSAKVGSGEVDVPVSFGGATFSPGALLTSDDDGIVVSRKPGSPG